MKSTLSVLFFIAVTTLFARAEDALKPNDAYKSIRTADTFAIGPTGGAGVISDTEVAFRVLLKQPDGVDLFKRLLPSATPAGQLYALLGLQSLDQKAFGSVAPKFLRSPKEVDVIRGCIVWRLSTAEVVSDIQAGKLK